MQRDMPDRSFQLPFDSRQQISAWAARYEASEEGRADALIEREVAPTVRRARFFTRDDLLTLGTWKSRRSGPLLAGNPAAFVEEVTRIALAPATGERLRIEILTLLRGVGWPTASAILHWSHEDRYPVLDFRALEALGQDVRDHRGQPDIGCACNFAFWWDYVVFCRREAARHRVSLRELDRALWQLSSSRQLVPRVAPGAANSLDGGGGWWAALDAPGASRTPQPSRRAQ
jgi:hypothetical protein